MINELKVSDLKDYIQSLENQYGPMDKDDRHYLANTLLDTNKFPTSRTIFGDGGKKIAVALEWMDDNDEMSNILILYFTKTEI